MRSEGGSQELGESPMNGGLPKQLATAMSIEAVDIEGLCDNDTRVEDSKTAAVITHVSVVAHGKELPGRHGDPSEGQHVLPESACVLSLGLVEFVVLYGAN